MLALLQGINTSFIFMHLFFNFIILLFYVFKHGEIERSRAELSEIDALIQTVEWAGEDGALLRRCLDGVEHVLQATWAHLANRNTPLKDMWYEIAQIVPFKDLSAQQQAAVWGLQASCRYCFFGECQRLCAFFVVSYNQILQH